MSDFRSAVDEQLRHDRSNLVVDNLHAYARIEQRVRSLWDALCLLGEKQLTPENLLYIYASIAAMAQHAAESVHAVDPTAPIVDERDKLIEELQQQLQQLQMKKQGWF